MFDYQATKDSCTKDFFEYTKQLQVVSENLYYNYLSDEGKVELDFLLMYMHKNMDVQRIQFLGSLANILMIYLPTSEIYQILKALIKQSDKMKTKDPEQRQRLRWHIPTNAEDHTQLISTFIAGYMQLK